MTTSPSSVRITQAHHRLGNITHSFDLHISHLNKKEGLQAVSVNLVMVSK